MSDAEQVHIGQYADVMPDMADEEYQALKRSIAEHGLDDPIKVTPSGVVLDGHHRLRACEELGIEPETETVDDDPELALRANLARRDLSQGGKREVVKRYLTDHYDGGRTQQEVADDLGVSNQTVMRAKRELQESGKDFQPETFSKTEKRRQVRNYLAENPDAPNREAADAVDADVSHATVGNWRNEWDADDSNEGTDHTNGDGDLGGTLDLDAETFTGEAEAANDSAEPLWSEDTDDAGDTDETDTHSVVDAATKQETDEWSSPRELVEPLAETLDGFDLDPCSGAETSPFADETYTAEDDGLAQPWHGTVWVNPPYSEMPDWTAKAVAEADREDTDAIYYLCKGDSSTEWWHDALDAASLVVAIDHRLSFGDGGNSAPFASHIFVFGTPDDATLRELNRHGAVLSHLQVGSGGGSE